MWKNTEDPKFLWGKIPDCAAGKRFHESIFNCGLLNKSWFLGFE